MIGLKRHTIEVVDHDPGWAALAAAACQAVRDARGELLVDVQHVGSTAIPGLPAKPIIDIAAAVATSGSIPELVRRLAQISFRYKGDRGDAGGHLFVADSAPEIRTIHMHVVEHGSRQWQDYVRFRDLLRHRPAIRKRYAELKEKLANIYRNDRELYAGAKADFIRGVLMNNVAGTNDFGDENRGD